MAWVFLLTMLAAVALIALSTCQFVAIGIASGRVAVAGRQRRAIDLRGLRQAAEIARLSSELQSSSDGSNLKWRVMEVAEIIDESVDCRSYYLVDAYRQPLPKFNPGQHVMVRPALAGNYQTTRCYSLSSSPDSRYWRITVKRQYAADSNRRNPHNGGLSVWLHDTMGIGNCLLIGGPNGHFFLADDNRRPLVLLAAGVGITPLASMLRWSMETTPERPIHLFYQAQDRDHWPLGQSLHTWTKAFPNCQVTSYFSREAATDLKSLQGSLPGTFLPGKFTATDVCPPLNQQEYDYFLCGPDAWMETLRNELQAAGVATPRIHWETFGSRAESPSRPSEELSQALSVRFQFSQVDALWSDPDQSLWELARQHHVEIASGCLSGACGCCRVKLLSGEVEYDRKVSIELADNECLTCIARPKTPCCIDA